MNISNSYCEKRKQTYIFKQHNLFKAALFTRLFRHNDLTNYLTNGINLLNQAKKIIKEVKKVSHNTKIAFSSIVTRKYRKNIDKKILEVNSHLKNYCSQKNIDFIDNNNIKEEHLGVKKLHLNKRGNSVLASNILKYLRSTF